MRRLLVGEEALAVVRDPVDYGPADAFGDQAAGDESKAAGAPTGKLLVTLALDAPSVERVVFAAEHGTVWLSAEPSDAPEDGTKIVERGNVY